MSVNNLNVAMMTAIVVAGQTVIDDINTVDSLCNEFLIKELNVMGDPIFLNIIAPKMLHGVSISLLDEVIAGRDDAARSYLRKWLKTEVFDGQDYACTLLISDAAVKVLGDIRDELRIAGLLDDETKYSYELLKLTRAGGVILGRYSFDH